MTEPGLEESVSRGATAVANGAAVDQPWHTVPAAETLEAYGSARTGLSEGEAASRLERYGPNEVEAERATPAWKLLLHQLQDPLIYILLIAAVVTLLLRDYVDMGVILAVVALNSLIGFVQEYRARQAMQALAALSAPRAEVVREGRARPLPSRELVPGDVVRLASGDRVPADLRLLELRDLAVDESALTGESVPVQKSIEALAEPHLVPGDQFNMVFAGTVATRGRALGVVVRTGAATELGRIASAMREVGETATPLQEKMHRLGHWVGLAVVGLSVIVAVVGLIQAMTLAEVLLAAIAVAVATIPEGLPVVLTVTLAVGVRRMAKRRAIIRSLPAVETLGSTTIIGSDKTGTLTKNQMTVRSIWAGGRHFAVTGVGYTLDGAVLGDGERTSVEKDEALAMTLLAGVLANEADPAAMLAGEPRGDPTELALLVSGAKGGVALDEVKRSHPELDVLPFEPERKFMASLNASDGEKRLFLKGAPETILTRCDRQLTADGGDPPIEPEAVREAAADLASRGLRVLAMAYRPAAGDRIEEGDLEHGFVFAGLQGMEDPVREEAVDAVEAAGQAGVRVLMLTGDHVATARAIGAQLGLAGAEDRAVEGQELEDLDDASLDEILDGVNIFARVAPEHKLRIVLRLRERGEVVAVTGDGVNDAPALRAAHLGVAMGVTGTDVAREASDMVLQDDNFATITAAVEEGRVVFANIRKVTFFLLSTGVAMPLTILVGLATGLPLIMLPAQILWINLVTNGLQDVALAFEPGEPGLLRRRPRPPREGIVTGRILQRLGAVGVLLAAGTLGVFWWIYDGTGDVDLARTAAMTQMVVFQFFHVFNSRSLDRSILRVPPFSNRFLFVSLLLAAGAHLSALYVPFLQVVFRTVPLTTEEWLIILVVGSTVILGGEIDKWVNRRSGRLLG